MGVYMYTSVRGRWRGREDERKRERRTGREQRREDGVEGNISYYWNATSELITDRCRSTEPGSDLEPLCGLDAEMVIMPQRFKA